MSRIANKLSPTLNKDGKRRKRHTSVKGVPEALAFQAVFPLSADPNVPLAITSRQFDTWARVDLNAYDHTMLSDAEVLNVRNRLRYKVNNGACKPAFVTKGGTPFHVMVNLAQLGRDKGYLVVPAAHALRKKAQRLPVKMDSVYVTQWDLIDRLHGSIDVHRMPPEVQLAIQQTIMTIESTATIIEPIFIAASKQIEHLQAILKLAVRQNPQIAHQMPEVQQIIDLNGGSDEDEDEGDEDDEDDDESADDTDEKG